jgi:hypothetical protein
MGPLEGRLRGASAAFGATGGARQGRRLSSVRRGPCFPRKYGRSRRWECGERSWRRSASHLLRRRLSVIGAHESQYQPVVRAGDVTDVVDELAAAQRPRIGVLEDLVLDSAHVGRPLAVLVDHALNRRRGSNHETAGRRGSSSNVPARRPSGRSERAADGRGPPSLVVIRLVCAETLAALGPQARCGVAVQLATPGESTYLGPVAPENTRRYPPEQRSIDPPSRPTEAAWHQSEPSRRQA